MEFTCRTSGDVHGGLPFSYGANAPNPWFSLSLDERQRAVLGGEQCEIDDDRFVRGCIEIPVVDGPGPFVWGAWVSLSKANYERVADLWAKPGRELEPPYFGWLCTSIPTYAETTLLLKTDVRTRPVGERPLIVLHDSDHPLAVEQREGMTMRRVQEIAEELLHR